MRKDRKGMNEVVQSIIDKVHASGGRFMEQNWRKMWIEVTPKVRKQKVERYVLTPTTVNFGSHFDVAQYFLCYL